MKDWVKAAFWAVLVLGILYWTYQLPRHGTRVEPVPMVGRSEEWNEIERGHAEFAKRQAREAAKAQPPQKKTPPKPAKIPDFIKKAQEEDTYVPNVPHSPVYQ
jgi:hypothetical protein